MNLSEIAERTGTNPRHLRYVVDHALVPSAATASAGRGTPREFGKETAYAVAVAARLLDAGMGRRLVRDILNSLISDQQKSPVIWHAATFGKLIPGAEWAWEFGDAEAERTCKSNFGHVEQVVCSPWKRIQDGTRMDIDYRPITIVRLDLHELSRRLWS
jgi:hypothetical protein